MAAEWFGKKVFDIKDLHSKELEFEVMIYQLKLRELAKNVIILIFILLDELLSRNFHK